MPDDGEQSRQNMIIAAEFMARMIQKYGKTVLAKIEVREKASEDYQKNNDKQMEEMHVYSRV